MGDARWEGAEWVGDEGRELGKAVFPAISRNKMNLMDSNR